MNKQLWLQAQKLFEQSLTLDESARSAFIATKTAGKDELRQLLEVMLKAEDDEVFMLSQPTVEVNESLTDEQAQVFGHFTIVRKVAVGGMGRIFKARSNHSDVDVYVALKLIRKELLSDQITLRFDNEKAILGKLKHHNIALLIDAGVVNETPYIATEWIDGQPINEYVQENQLSVNQTLNLFLQVCEAVAYAHTQLVIHRDLKPANILIDSNKQVKLLDFGIAKLLDGSNSQTTQTQVFTPDYAAPEQINGDACTTATDTYALGVLLFELLVGDKRFGLEELSMAEKIKAIAQPKTVFASQVMQTKQLSQAHKVKGALDTIINHAMHPDPKRRYPAVYELINDIQRFQQYLPIQAMGDGWAYRSQMFFKRNPWSSSLAMLLLIALSTGLFYSNVQKQQAIQAQKLAQTEADKSQQMLNFFMTMMESASPDSGGSTQITVQQMFEKSSNKFDLNSIDDPVLRAAIAVEIANFYGELGANDLKLLYNQLAADYYAENLEHHATEFLQAKLGVASAYQRQANNEMVLKELLEAKEKVLGHDYNEEDLAHILIMMAWTYDSFDQNDEAISSLSQAEELGLKINSPNVLGQVKYYQHMILEDQVSPAESLAYLTQAEAYIAQAYQGTTHPDLLAIRNSLGLTYRDQGQYREAIEIYQALHTEYNEFYGRKNHNQLINHANVAYYLGQFQTTVDLSEESLEIMATHDFGEGFSYMAASLAKGRGLVELKRYTEADVLLTKVMDYFSEPERLNPVAMLTLRSYWLDFLLKSGRLAENKDDIDALLTSAYDYLSVTNKSKRKYVNILTGIAFYYWQTDQKTAALAELEAAQNVVGEISLKQEWGYWLVEAGVQQLRQELGLEYDTEKLNAAKHELFMLLPENHWYHNFFAEQ